MKKLFIALFICAIVSFTSCESKKYTDENDNFTDVCFVGKIHENKVYWVRISEFQSLYIVESSNGTPISSMEPGKYPKRVLNTTGQEVTKNTENTVTINGATVSISDAIKILESIKNDK